MTVNEIENISETRIEKEGREGEGEGEEQEQQCESINQGASFSLVWSSGIDVFKRIIKTLGKLEGEGEITFKVTKDGLFYRQMDRSHVSLIDLYFSSEDFESFQCMREGKFTIRSEDLLSRLDRAGREDLLELSSSSSSSSIENSDSLNIILKGRRTTKSFSLNLTMDSPKSDTPLPKLSFESSFQIQAKDLIEVLKDIETTNNHFTLKATNGRQQVVFFAKGDLGTVKDELTHLEINTSVEEQHQGQQITEKETIATYSIQYLSDFLNTLKPESIKVEFSTKMPLRLTVQPLKEGSSKSILQFYLAPRIDEI